MLQHNLTLYRQTESAWSPLQAVWAVTQSCTNKIELWRLLHKMAPMTCSLAGKEIRIHTAQPRLPGQNVFLWKSCLLFAVAQQTASSWFRPQYMSNKKRLRSALLIGKPCSNQEHLEIKLHCVHAAEYSERGKSHTVTGRTEDVVILTTWGWETVTRFD